MEKTAMEAAHEFAQMLRTGSKILVVTGAGVEYDLGNPDPNLCHRLCALVTAIGGAHVTTNISGVQLLSQPNEQERNRISFVPVRGTLYDQEKGRDGRGGRRRPRCKSDAHQQPLLQGRGITVPIVGSVEDEDPNMVAARASAKEKTFLLILGTSLPTNGRALHFLDAADSVERVIFVNIDASRDGAAITEALEGRGLPVGAKVSCVAMKGEEFADAALHFAAEASQPAQLREVVERSKHWVQKEKVNEMRRLVLLPPKSELSVAKQPFGAAKVTAGKIYDLQKAAAAAAAVQPAAQPVKKGESEESRGIVDLTEEIKQEDSSAGLAPIIQSSTTKSTMESPDSTLEKKFKSILIYQASDVSNDDTAQQNLDHLYKMQKEMDGIVHDCVIAALLKDPNATPIDVANLLNGVRKFPSTKVGRPIIMSSNTGGLPRTTVDDDEDADLTRKVDNITTGVGDVSVSSGVGVDVPPSAVATMDEVDVQSGEEEEELIYSQRGKLFIWGETLLNVGSGNKQWNERGIGDIRILKHCVHQGMRVLMFQRGTRTAMVNHALDPRITLEPNVGSDRSWVWSAFNYVTGELVETVFAIRFADSDTANAFKTNFVEQQATVDVDVEAEAEADTAADAIRTMLPPQWQEGWEGMEAEAATAAAAADDTTNAGDNLGRTSLERFLYDF